MASTNTHRFTVCRRLFQWSAEDVERAMAGIAPEPTARHFVVVSCRQYPPKQVLGELTGFDRADFTTHQARRILMNLGFPAGRRPEPGAQEPERTPRDEPALVETLRQFAGQWVAVAGDELLVAEDSPRDVVAWLARHGRRADSMFRVPEDELSVSGLAPL